MASEGQKLMTRFSSKYDEALEIMKRDNPSAGAARALLMEAVKEGDARANYALGTWYLHGAHVEKNVGWGIALLEKAADEKLVDALFELANVYERGHGVAVNEQKAFDLYSRAASEGDAGAMEEVGRMLYYGIGVAENRDAADYWLEKAETAASRQPQSQRMVD